MNITATFEKLSLLRLHGFERAYREITQSARQEKFTLDELIAHLVDAEYDDKYNKKLTRLLKQAKLRQQASFEQIDFQQPRGLDKNQALRLQSCDWIKKSRDLLITGPTGAGKSFIACAFGHQACAVVFYHSSISFDRLLHLPEVGLS
jgi:DNA replication protein DnaC